jgi:hypothetical protein
MAQIAAPLFALSQGDDGAHRISLRLEPAELGQVEIRIDRAANAPTHVEITVERSETMTLLLRDQAQLQHTLDRAGVPAEGRTLDIHLTPPDLQPTAPSFGAGSGTDAGPTGGGAGTPHRQPHQPWRQDEPQQKQRRTGYTPPHWLHAGLDITA